MDKLIVTEEDDNFDSQFAEGLRVVDQVNGDEDTTDQLGAGVDDGELDVTDEDYFYPKFQQISLDGLLQDVNLQAHKPYNDLNV